MLPRRDHCIAYSELSVATPCRRRRQPLQCIVVAGKSRSLTALTGVAVVVARRRRAAAAAGRQSNGGSGGVGVCMYGLIARHDGLTAGPDSEPYVY